MSAMLRREEEHRCQAALRAAERLLRRAQQVHDALVKGQLPLTSLNGSTNLVEDALVVDRQVAVLSTHIALRQEISS